MNGISSLEMCMCTVRKPMRHVHHVQSILRHEYILFHIGYSLTIKIKVYLSMNF